MIPHESTANKIVDWINEQIERWAGKVILISAFIYFAGHLLNYFLFTK